MVTSAFLGTKRHDRSTYVCARVNLRSRLCLGDEQVPRNAREPRLWVRTRKRPGSAVLADGRASFAPPCPECGVACPHMRYLLATPSALHVNRTAGTPVHPRRKVDGAEMPSANLIELSPDRLIAADEIPEQQTWSTSSGRG